MYVSTCVSLSQIKPTHKNRSHYLAYITTAELYLISDSVFSPALPIAPHIYTAVRFSIQQRSPVGLDRRLEWVGTG